MIKIFKYEFRIILCKAYVPAILAAGMLYSWYLLSTQIILGVSDTAPFSGWSFGKYLGDSTLISMLITLLITAVSLSGQQKMAGILTDATAFPVKKRILIRSLLTGGFFLICTIINLILGCIFLYSLFGEIYIGSYLLDWALICLPCMFLITGMGMLIGRKSNVPIYIFMGVCLIMAFAFRRLSLDFNGAAYFEITPGLFDGPAKEDPPFVIGLSYVIKRSVYLFAGMAAYFISCSRAADKRRIERAEQVS